MATEIIYSASPIKPNLSHPRKNPHCIGGFFLREKKINFIGIRKITVRIFLVFTVCLHFRHQLNVLLNASHTQTGEMQFDDDCKTLRHCRRHYR